MLLVRQEETERSHVFFAPYMGKFFPKKLFMRSGTFWRNLYKANLKVAHWCVNGDVGSYFDLGQAH